MIAEKHQIKTITENEFLERFRPLPNHLDRDAGFALDSGGCLYATSPKEMKYVLAQGHRHVWTLIEEDGQLFVESGLHFVNRLGYLVTENPIEPETTYSVIIDD